LCIVKTNQLKIFRETTRVIENTNARDF